MNRSALWLLAISTSLLLAPSARADEKAPKPADAAGMNAEEHEADHDSLHEAMEEMEEAYQALKAGIDDPKGYNDLLAQIDSFQEAVIESRMAGIAPDPKLNEERNRARAVTFRRMLGRALRVSLELEDALLAGDKTRATRALKLLHEVEEKGHTAFRVEEGDDHDKKPAQHDGDAGEKPGPRDGEAGEKPGPRDGEGAVRIRVREAGERVRERVNHEAVNHEAGER